MGSYTIGQQEIIEALEDCLDSLEGDVYKKDFEKACAKVLKTYKYFTDSEEKTGENK